MAAALRLPARLALLLVAGAFTGCATLEMPPPQAAAPPPPPAAPPPAAPPAAAPPGAAPAPRLPVVSIGYTGGKGEVSGLAVSFADMRDAPEGLKRAVRFGIFPPFGVALMPKSMAESRKAAFCRAVFKAPTRSAAAWEANPRKYVVTLWFHSLNREVSDEERDPAHCGFLVEKYDYDASWKYLTELGRLGSAGPVFAAWDNMTGHAVLWDLSRAPDDDMERLVGIWSQQIARDSAEWNDGLLLIKSREEVRFALNRYGETILKYITPSAEAAEPKRR